MRDHIDTGHTDLHHTVLRFLSFPNAFSKDPFGSGFCLSQMPRSNLNSLNVELPDMSGFGFEKARKTKEEKANEKKKKKEQEDDLEKEKEKEDVKEQKDENVLMAPALST